MPMPPWARKRSIRYPASMRAGGELRHGGAYAGFWSGWDRSDSVRRRAVFGLHQATATELQARIEAERAGAPFVDLLRRRGPSAAGRSRRGNITRSPIGRAHDVAIRITGDSQVSRVHAELERVGEHWVVADEGLSRNGTYLNEARITGRRRLADRDVVRGRSDPDHVPRAGRGAESSTLLGDSTELAASITPRSAVCSWRSAARSAAARPTPPRPPTRRSPRSFSSPWRRSRPTSGAVPRVRHRGLPQQEKRQRLVALAFASGLVTERDLAGT